MSPYAFLAHDSSPKSSPQHRIAFDSTVAELTKAGILLVDLAVQATKLASFIAENESARQLAGSLCLRAEGARSLGRKLALSPESTGDQIGTLLNDAILALDGVAIEVEYASEVNRDIKVKNQVARARLAVTTAGTAIDDARRAFAARA